MKPVKVDIELTKPQVMAILNVTPDSFYSGSRTFTDAEIGLRVERVIADGATIIDVGGYSSRPNADDIPLDEEWDRVDRGLAVVRSIDNSITISVDTFRSEIAERAIEKYGALIINDITAGQADSKMLNVAAKYDVPYIAMHMRGTPQTMQQMTQYSDVVDDIVEYFRCRLLELKRAGVKKIILDPGFGFAKNVEQNYALMRNLNRLLEFGRPILSGISRKSMIYKPLSINPEKAITGTIALNWESLRQGATILRVHDVQEAVEVVKLYELFKG